MGVSRMPQKAILWSSSSKSLAVLNNLSFYVSIFAHRPHFPVSPLCFQKLSLALKTDFFHKSPKSPIFCKLNSKSSNAAKTGLCANKHWVEIPSNIQRGSESTANLNTMQTNYQLTTDFWGSSYLLTKKTPFIPFLLPQCATGDSSLRGRGALWKADQCQAWQGVDGLTQIGGDRSKQDT